MDTRKTLWEIGRKFKKEFAKEIYKRTKKEGRKFTWLAAVLGTTNANLSGKFKHGFSIGEILYLAREYNISLDKIAEIVLSEYISEIEIKK